MLIELDCPLAELVSQKLYNRGMRKNRPWPTWVWLLIALTLRVILALAMDERYYQIDELGYDLRSWNLASTGILGQRNRSLIVPPLPHAFFAFFFWIFGHYKLA